MILFGLGLPQANAETTVERNVISYYPEGDRIYVVHFEFKICVKEVTKVCHFDISTFQHNIFNDTAIGTYDRRVSDKLILHNVRANY